MASGRGSFLFHHGEWPPEAVEPKSEGEEGGVEQTTEHDDKRHHDSEERERKECGACASRRGAVHVHGEAEGNGDHHEDYNERGETDGGDAQSDPDHLERAAQGQIAVHCP